ncbi:MAG: putative adenylyltransferase/sulfurtransferase MoeZ [bacterium ADurb.Bin400]|nr:MAG: putative adenylyltransferase/sulfurtransferase MoeZ [bacterium ADurb.Bin400]
MRKNHKKQAILGTFAGVITIGVLLAFVSKSEAPTKTEQKQPNNQDVSTNASNYSQESTEKSMTPLISKAILVEEAVQLLEQNSTNPDFIILDVRTQEEYGTGYIKNAKNIDFYSATFLTSIDSLDRSKKYLIYCRTGNRSNQTLEAMKELNFKEIYDLTGGITEWTKQNLPIEVPKNETEKEQTSLPTIN